MAESEQSAGEIPGPRPGDSESAAQAEDTEPARRAMSETVTNIVIELGRADGKAGILLGWVGAAVALLTTTASGRHLSLSTAIVVWLADALLAGAVALLLSVVRPYLKPGVSWVRYANLDSESILQDMRKISSRPGSDSWGPERIRELSRLAVSKYRKIRWAVDLLFASGALLFIALLTAA